MAFETQEEPAHHLGHIKNVGSLLGAPEANFAVSSRLVSSRGSTQRLPNPFNFRPVRCLGFRKPEAQSKGKLERLFRPEACQVLT